MTQAHPLHCRYRVGVAFHQPVAHFQLNFMRLCLEGKEDLRYFIMAPASVGYRGTDEEHVRP